MLVDRASYAQHKSGTTESRIVFPGVHRGNARMALRWLMTEDLPRQPWHLIDSNIRDHSCYLSDGIFDHSPSNHSHYLELLRFFRNVTAQYTTRIFLRWNRYYHHQQYAHQKFWSRSTFWKTYKSVLWQIDKIWSVRMEKRTRNSQPPSVELSSLDNRAIKNFQHGEETYPGPILPPSCAEFPD